MFRRFITIGGNIIWILVIGGMPDFSSAGGPVHGAKSAGMGTAFVAVADDPSAMAINPAGLSQSKGTWIYSGLTAVYPKTSFESLQGVSNNTEDNVYFPPHIYFSSQLGLEDWTFGLALFSPFGIGGRVWPDDSLTRYLSTESAIVTFTANPTVAWQMFPQLSVAVGVNFMKNEIPPAGILDQTQNLDWKDVWQIKVGIDYRLSDPIALRCGYAYVNSPVPERTLTPANPDAIQHSFAVGLGYHIRQWIIDVFYTAGFFEDRTVDNDILSGTYENFTHYSGISIGYQF